MPRTQRWVVPCIAVALAWNGSGCIHDAVAQGAWIGAVSGAAVGAGTGVLISDEHLLGSTKASKLEIDSGAAIASGSLIGAVFGAIVGAMIGHQQETKFPVRGPTPAQANGATPGEPSAQPAVF